MPRAWPTGDDLQHDEAQNLQWDLLPLPKPEKRCMGKVRLIEEEVLRRKDAKCRLVRSAVPNEVYSISALPNAKVVMSSQEVADEKHFLLFSEKREREGKGGGLPSLEKPFHAQAHSLSVYRELFSHDAAEDEKYILRR